MGHLRETQCIEILLGTEVKLAKKITVRHIVNDDGLKINETMKINDIIHIWCVPNPLNLNFTFSASWILKLYLA